MSTKVPPTSMVRSQLGALLAQLRVEAGLRQSEAVTKAGVLDKGGLSRVEGGTRGITQPTAERLLDCYNVTGEGVRNEILELIRLDASLRRKPQWWKRHNDVLSPTAFDNYLGLEAVASEIRNYEPLVIPGILQTPEYASAVVPALRPDLTEAQVRRFAEIRAARQRRILAAPSDQGDGPRLTILVDERAVEPPAAGPAVMNRQFQHLIDAADHPRITLRMSLKSVGLHPGLTGGFVIMKFPSHAVRDVACAELMSRSVYPQDEDEVSRYHNAFDWLWQRALTPTETQNRLRTAMEELQQ
ncbi:helix-turn-helix transcriptional regulator [Streptomyces sp. NPDC006510]|uniref:helix-turn-helix domain-containing protein n=1 Tax=Streptomyces sp. NPDC006510 TaxID=3155600 RepID=UPI0033A2997B